MSIEVANESTTALIWGNEKWATTNPNHRSYTKEILSEKIITNLPITNTVCAETERGGDDGTVVVPSTVGKKRGRAETKKTNNGKSSGEADQEQGVHIWTERERRKKMRNMFSNLHALLPQLPSKADKSSIVDEAVSYIKTLQQTLQKLQRQKLQKLQPPHKSIPEPPPPSLATTTTRQAFQADHHINTHNHNYNDDVMMCNNINSTNNISAAANCSSNNDVVVFQTWTSTNLVLNICGDEAQINICSPAGKKKVGDSGSNIFTAVCYVLEKHNIEVLSAHVSSNSDRRLLMIQARHTHPQEENNGGGGHDQGLGADHNYRGIDGVEIFKQAAAEMLSYLCPSPIIN